MILFQAFLLISLALLLLLIGFALKKGRIGRGTAFIWTIVCIAATLATLAPNVTTSIANTVGIHRGTDLLLYVMVLVMGFGFFSMYLRLRQVRREFTVLIRKIAIAEAGPNHDENNKPSP